MEFRYIFATVGLERLKYLLCICIHIVLRNCTLNHVYCYPIGLVTVYAIPMRIYHFYTVYKFNQVTTVETYLVSFYAESKKKKKNTFQYSKALTTVQKRGYGLLFVKITQIGIYG